MPLTHIHFGPLYRFAPASEYQRRLQPLNKALSAFWPGVKFRQLPGQFGDDIYAEADETTARELRCFCSGFVHGFWAQR